MELEATTSVPVHDLRLVPADPRLVGEGAGASDEWSAARLYRSADFCFAV